MHSRNFETENDLHTIRNMLVDARRIAGHTAGYWHVGDLTWRHCIWFCPQNYRLWYDDDQLVGFAVFTDYFYFYWQVHPNYLWRGIEQEMLAWVEMRWHQAMDDAAIPSDRKRNLVPSAFENDSQRIAFLEQNGFTRGEHPMIHFARSLAEPIADSQLPDGFSLRGVSGKHEASDRAQAHRQAFQSSYVTDDGYRTLMQMSEYDRELDLVAVSPDGIIAAFAMSWVDPQNKVGEFEPVGARTNYRRKGLTRAVLLEGLKRMKLRGAEMAIVSTNTNNVTQGLYESVGFCQFNRELDFVRLNFWAKFTHSQN